jgi:hypothetical protein
MIPDTPGYRDPERPPAREGALPECAETPSAPRALARSTRPAGTRPAGFSGWAFASDFCNRKAPLNQCTNHVAYVLNYALPRSGCAHFRQINKRA